MSELYDTPKHDDLIYDVGTHRGEDAEFYLQNGFRVVAFEADPDLVQHCRVRLKLFIDQGRLEIVEGAIVSPNSIEAGQGKTPFYRNDDVSAWGTVRADWAERNVGLGTSNRVLEVEVTDFAGVMRRQGVPHYLKIDIEGLDMVCVDALRRFRERPDYVSMESDKFSFATIRREIDALVDLGYDSFQAVEQSDIPHAQSPPYPAREGEYVDQRFEKGASGLFGAELAGEWKSRTQILRQYRLIRIGYFLLGDGGILKGRHFPGAGTLRRYVQRPVRLLTKAPVPGWYDTHARHSSVTDNARSRPPRRRAAS
ncbi:MAG TPA: FkbM family methyltransferase [Rhodothermia bacterium]